MKKIMLIICIMLLVGCNEKKVEPIKDTVDTIQDSKKSIAVTKTQSMINEAEMKFLTLDKSCISVNELSQNAESGMLCLESNGNIYAKDVKIEGYICNGNKMNVSCVGDNSDK